MRKILTSVFMCLLFMIVASSCSSGGCISCAVPAYVIMDSNAGGVADGAVNVSLTPVIVLQFSESMNPSSINSSTVILSTSANLSKTEKSLNSSVVISNIVANPNNTIFSFSPQSPLNSNTKYYVIVSNAKTINNAVVNAKFSFTTGDYTAPMVSIITPSNGESNVELHPEIKLYFSESVINVNTTNVRLHQNTLGGELVAITEPTQVGGNTYVFTPLADLKAGTTYYIELSSGITDLNNNALSATNFNFETLENRVSSVSTAAIYACGIKLGKAYCWGSNSRGELGNGTTVNESIPVAIAVGGNSAIPEDVNLVSIATGSAYNSDGASCAVDDLGDAYCWGDGEAGNIGDGLNTISNPYPVKVAKGGSSAIPLESKLIKIGTTNNNSCAIDIDGEGYCWGDNTQGQFGNGTTTNSNYPTKIIKGGSSAIPVGDKLIDIAVGSLYTCALDEHGKAFCWGWNTNGQCGSGDYVDNLYPTAVAVSPNNSSSQITAQTVLKQISASANTPCPANEVSTCAVDVDGGGYCWGNNSLGQLGVNLDSTALFNSPVPLRVLLGLSPSQIPAGAKFSMIASGSGSTCGIADSKAYCWGLNASGELGNNSTTNSTYPVAVNTTSGAISSMTQLKNISVADYGDIYLTGIACAVDTKNNFYCWGNNDYGQLGNHALGTSSNVPVNVLIP